MPTRKSTKKDETKPYVAAGLAVLTFGLLSLLIGRVIMQPANAWLILLGDLLILSALLLIIVSMQATKRAGRTKKSKKK